MRIIRELATPGFAVGIALALAGCSARTTGGSVQPVRVFETRGVVKSLRPDGASAVIQHESIPGYMEAMTMPFRVKDAAELKGVKAGDTVRFRFHVAEDESWMDRVVVLQPGVAEPASRLPGPPPTTGVTNAASRQPHPLMDFKFTNQLNQPVSLGDFKGQALAITFIFTRCPIPDYCPRLTKNFQEVSQRLSQRAAGPTNWHLVCFTIDPAFDSPPVLKAYAERYQYNPARWSFLTGPAEKITDLVRESGVTVEPAGGLFSHNFRTLIVGTNGQLLTSIPIGGPIAGSIVLEMLKALGTTNAP